MKMRHQKEKERKPMDKLCFLLFILGLAVVNVHASGVEISASYNIEQLNRSSFPSDFIFGAATSAYQIEGAWNIDGKGPSIWDHYAHKYPEKITDRSNGDVAADSYRLYKTDIKLLKRMNSDAYRFSISWPRILPRGKLSGGVNEKGIEYYNKLIDEIIAQGLQPFVTLFHWDTPQALEDEYHGFLSPKIINHFRDFANLCFERFGDRVKHWTTFNEPETFCVAGYDQGIFAPFRCSDRSNCVEGNSGTDPYIVGHHQLIAHAVAVKLYREKYQAIQKGKIGIVLVSWWFIPLTNSSADHEAAQRQLDFMLGWFMQPLMSGDYPAIMRQLVKDRLPKFTTEQSELLKGSIDFLGLNYYTSQYAANDLSVRSNFSYSTDSQVIRSYVRNGVFLGAATASNWLYIYPQGLYSLLRRIKEKYNDPIIYITENGVDEVNNSTLSLKQALKDGNRIKYYHDHLYYLHKAIKDGVRVKGYFGWALIDNFEWSSGYTVRFGIHFVDYVNDAKTRYPKLSARWFRKFLTK